MKRHYLAEVVGLIKVNYKIVGKIEESYFTNTKSVLEATEESIVFIAKNRTDKKFLVTQTKASIIICDEETEGFFEKKEGVVLIVVSEPKETFASLINTVFRTKPSPSVHPTAFIHPEAFVHVDAFIGPFTYVGKSSIGRGSIIYGHCHIYDNVTIGENVIIHAGTVIGADGFGYFRNNQDELENFPHLGEVVIEDHVEIGANTCIDKGALSTTRIKRGAKIDNLVHIAHNVVVGQNTMVIADAMVGGSTVIGDNSWIAPSSSLRDAIKVGSNVTIGMGAVITKNVPNNETWTGNPGRILKDFVIINDELKAIVKAKKH